MAGKIPLLGQPVVAFHFIHRPRTQARTQYGRHEQIQRGAVAEPYQATRQPEITDRKQVKHTANQYFGVQLKCRVCHGGVHGHGRNHGQGKNPQRQPELDDQPEHQVVGKKKQQRIEGKNHKAGNAQRRKVKIGRNVQVYLGIQVQRAQKIKVQRQQPQTRQQQKTRQPSLSRQRPRQNAPAQMRTGKVAQRVHHQHQGRPAIEQQITERGRESGGSIVFGTEQLALHQRIGYVQAQHQQPDAHQENRQQPETAFVSPPPRQAFQIGMKPHRQHEKQQANGE